MESELTLLFLTWYKTNSATKTIPYLNTSRQTILSVRLNLDPKGGLDIDRDIGMGELLMVVKQPSEMF